MALCGTVGILIATHWFVGKLYDHRQDAPSSVWTFRRTLCLIGGIGLVFFTGSAFMGTVHQAVWLLSSPEPMVEVKDRSIGYEAMETVDREFETALRQMRMSLV